MLADLELGFLLEVFLELELGLSVQLAVALVDRNLVRGPERNAVTVGTQCSILTC